jgi:predicted ATPase
MTGFGGRPPAGEPGRFAGREREISELRRLAGRARLVTLYGPGGVGKTRLLRELLAALADGYPDGAFLVALSDLSQPDLLAARVAAAAGIAEEPGVPPGRTLAASLAGRRVLLSLDGCEHLAGACVRLVQRLLASSPGLLVITASRVPLGLAAETAWPVPSLALPAAGTDDPQQARRSDSVALFADRAAGAAPGFALDQGNCAAVTAICRAARGVPLAIELAAARLRIMTAGQVSEHLGAAAPGPPPGEPAGPAGQQAAMHAATAWSHDLLTPPEQTLLRRLSGLPPWSLEMAERVCADELLPAGRVAVLLAGLARAGLVEPDPGPPGQHRYRMPGAVRDYAAACLARAGESEALQRRLRDYARHRAEYMVSMTTARVPVTWPVLRGLFRAFHADARVFRAVLQRCLDTGDADSGLRMCAQIGICWIGAGSVGEGARWLDAFLAIEDPAVPPAVRGPALVIRALLGYFGGDVPCARSLAAAGLELSRAAGDPFFTAMGLDVLARAALASADAPEALRHTGEALQIARAGSDWWNQVYALNTKARALAAAGRPDQARECAEAALALTLETDQHFGTALARMLLGELARSADDVAAARRHYLAALPFVREAMPAPETAHCLGRLGTLALADGDLSPAREYLAESLRLSLAVGSRAGVARGLLGFAELALQEGWPDRSVQLAAAATAVSEAASLPAPPSRRTRRYLAAAGLGDEEAAGLWSAGQKLTTSAAVALALEPLARAPAQPYPGGR